MRWHQADIREVKGPLRSHPRAEGRAKEWKERKRHWLLVRDIRKFKINISRNIQLFWHKYSKNLRILTTFLKLITLFYN